MCITVITVSTAILILFQNSCSLFGVQLLFPALGQGSLHNVSNCRLFLAHDHYPVLEGGDEGGVHTHQTPTFPHSGLVGELLHFRQFPLQLGAV